MILFAHSEGGHGWGGPIEPWELHPMLVHFPIAFLLGGVAVSLYARWRGRPALEQTATVLLIAGVLSGVVTALAGLLALYTVPDSHTEEAHYLMGWHLWLQAASLVLFACAAWLRWRARDAPPGFAVRAVGWVAAVVLVIGSGVSGYTVYHGGAGIDAALMKPGLHKDDRRDGKEEQHGPDSKKANHDH